MKKPHVSLKGGEWMELLTLVLVIVYGLIESIKAVTKLIDALISFKESIHKLKNHPDGHQSDSDEN